MKSKLRLLGEDLCPPWIWRRLSSVKRKWSASRIKELKTGQDLDVYWDQEMAELLETWGEGNVWNEIQLIMSNARGTALDIACGTGKVIEMLKSVPDLEIHGCDISDMLINKALERHISADRLQICDATSLPYRTDDFDYSYSIGSLEHFTESGLEKAIAEAARVTKSNSFHMVPTARSGRDEGWMKTYQSFHNCSVAWWTTRFDPHFRSVKVLDASWNDQISVGKWFLCSH